MTRMLRASLSMGFAAVVVVACSGSKHDLGHGDPAADGGSESGGGPAQNDGGTTTETSCLNLVETLCTKLAACSTHPIRQLYGNVQTCIDRGKPGCAKTLPGVSWTAAVAFYDTCARAFREASCEAVLS